PARDLWDSYQTRRQRHSRSLAGVCVYRCLCILADIWGLIRCVILPMLTGWMVATTTRLRPMAAALALALSSALRNLIPLLTNTIWRAIQYWPTHPFLPRADRNFFVELLTLTSLAFVATLAGAAVARKYQPFSKSELITT